MPIIDIKPKFSQIEDTVPKMLSVEATNIIQEAGFLTYDQAGATYDEAGYTYEGISGWSGNPPKL